MAQRVRTLLVDDLDGTEAHETVTFGLDRQSLEIDLSSDNADRLRTALAEFIQAARVVGGGRKRRRVSTGKDGGQPKVGRKTPVAQATSMPTTTGEQVAGQPQPLAFSAEVRQWAKGQGLKVSDRGRIANTVIEAYQSRTDPTPKARTKKAR
ncbi:histone-like nucleoid-structuring protein Lsr2 [Labedaea rhizosphaerae]|uniref:Lsr2 protein n=1 Tax=Labedaea rhizosphaerae TaxID=598644 RepID=A0A4R6SHX2_LABRH|nr:Lsr2 family protein [Labedaea rhizosphaerae]TDQ01227.1 Lsr2 protein [Labedaea rhizosphaerae]